MKTKFVDRMIIHLFGTYDLDYTQHRLAFVGKCATDE